VLATTPFAGRAVLGRTPRLAALEQFPPLPPLIRAGPATPQVGLSDRVRGEDRLAAPRTGGRRRGLRVQPDALRPGAPWLSDDSLGDSWAKSVRLNSESATTTAVRGRGQAIFSATRSERPPGVCGPARIRGWKRWNCSRKPPGVVFGPGQRRRRTGSWPARRSRRLPQPPTPAAAAVTVAPVVGEFVHGLAPKKPYALSWRCATHRSNQTSLWGRAAGSQPARASCFRQAPPRRLGACVSARRSVACEELLPPDGARRWSSRADPTPEGRANTRARARSGRPASAWAALSRE